MKWVILLAVAWAGVAGAQTSETKDAELNMLRSSVRSQSAQIQSLQASVKAQAAEIQSLKMEVAAAKQLRADLAQREEMNRNQIGTIQALREEIAALRAGAESPHKTTRREEAEAKPAGNVVGQVTRGGVTVRLLRAGTRKIKLVALGDELTESEEPQLAFDVEIANGSSTRKLDYRSWQKDMAFDGYAGLRDEHGNRYKRITFGFGTKIAGRVDSDSIYPGKSITDVLVFESPVPGAKKLILELPGKNVGLDDPITFEIPVAGLSK